MRNNLKKVSLFLSMVMLFVLASPLTVLAAEESSAASAKFYGTFWSLVPPLVASSAPALVLILLLAQRPKAAEPPALFIRHTIAPRITRKIRIPML